MVHDTSMLEATDKIFWPSLKYLDVAHPRLLILFSGPPSSGKSTVAAAIEDTLQAVRLENDRIRKIAGELRPQMTLEEKSALSYTYMESVTVRLLHYPNGLWIIDANIDEHYQKHFDFAAHHGFAYLVIAMQTPEDVRRKWIIETGDRPWASTQKYLAMMEMRHKQHEAFLATHTPDISLKPGYDIREVESLIKSRIKLLSA